MQRLDQGFGGGDVRIVGMAFAPYRLHQSRVSGEGWFDRRPPLWSLVLFSPGLHHLSPSYSSLLEVGSEIVGPSHDLGLTLGNCLSVWNSVVVTRACARQPWQRAVARGLEGSRDEPWDDVGKPAATGSPPPAQ